MNTSTLTDLERSVFSKVVGLAADEFSCHGSNDFPIKVTDDNYLGVLALIHKVAQDPDDAARLLARAVPGGTVYFNDWILLSTLKNMLLKK